MKYLRLFLVMVALSVSAYSQSVVISEYKDIQADAYGEWTEFLVVEEGASLANCTYRDNVTALNEWSGGVKFKDIPLWKNLKRGTVIIVHHRNSGLSYDDNVKDGYIEVAGDNSAYFTHYDPNPDPTRPWDSKALNISEQNEIMELLDPSMNHIISLSHSADVTGSMWRTLPAPKPNCAGNLSGGNQRKSVAIFPGGSKNAYLGTGGSQVAIIENTLGIPNGLPNAANSDYWRSIREPAWSSPGLTINPQTDGVNLTWNGSGDVFADFAGYMIIRYKKSAEAAVLVPKDGIVYNEGDKLGSAIVVKNVVNSTTYKDMSVLPCGETYEYRVYAYRFDAGDANIEKSEINARGRSYNQASFAKNSFDKIGPTAPKVTINDAKVVNGNVKFCKGESRKLTNIDYDLSKYVYNWYKDDRKIDGEVAAELTITESGNYSVALIDTKTNCYVYSNEFNVTVVPYPDVRIKVRIDANTIEVRNDTTVYVCPGSYFKAVGADNKSKYRWYKDGVELTDKAGSESYAPATSGIYYVSATNDSLCTDESAKINMIVKDIKLKFTPSSLDFTLDATQASENKTVMISNDNDYDIEIKTIIKSDNFEVISPAKPYIIPAKQSVPYVIRFLPNSDSTSYNQQMQFNHDCSTKSFLILTGSKAPSKLSIDKTSLDFKYLLDCENVLYKDLEIKLTNPGTDPIIITMPKITSPFEIVNKTDFPINLANIGDSKIIYVRYNKTVINSYTQDMQINYSVNGGKPDSLLVSLNGAVVNPVLNFDNEIFDIKTFTPTQNKQRQDIGITNTGEVPIILTMPTISGITFTQWPTSVINPGATDTIKMEITYSAIPYNFDIAWDKCNKTTNIRISCSITGYSIVEPVFGYFAYCPDRDSSFERDLTIKFIGSPQNSTISNIVNSPNFALGISEGASITDGMIIKVLFTGEDVNKYNNQEIKFTLKPSDSTFTIKLNAEIFYPSFSVTDTVFFPRTIPSQTSDKRYIKIYNNNPIPIFIESISEPFPNNNFKKFDNTTTYPIQINSFDSLKVDYLYIPQYDNTHIAVVTINYSFKDGCSLRDTTSTLHGYTGDNDTFKLNLKFNAPKRAKIGTTQSIPVLMTLDTTSGGVKYISARITRVDFDLEYNETVILPQTMVAEQAIAADSFMVTKIGKNKSHCSFIIKEPESMNDGKLFSIRSRFLWGNATSSDFKISNIKCKSSKILKHEDDSTTIALFGDCDFESGLLEIGASSGMKVNNKNGFVSIDYQLLAEDYSTLEVYNTLGEQVFQKDITNKQGNYSININQEFIAGLYVAILRNGNFPRTVKFVITK